MSKNKYAKEGTATNTVAGESKQRDHTKSGKLAKRRETRRLEAIGRQVQRIQLVEAAVKGDKVPKDVTEYIATFKTPAEALAHAKITLQKIRGGVPHSQLVVKAAVAAEAPKTPEGGTTPTPVAEEKPKNKYRKRKSAKLAEAKQ